MGKDQKIKDMTETAIHIENLSRNFGPVIAIENLSMDVPSGSIFGFLGPNGAGKTTTIRLLLGLLEPTEGHAEVLGLDIRTQAEQIRASTGALLENTGLYEQMSAEDNLEFYGRVFRIPEKDRRGRIQELLNLIGLWERRKERVDTWSRGMRQKLALTRALLHRPRLVLLDEPTAGLDVVAAAVVHEQLAEMVAHERITVFLTTHNMSEVEKLCGHVAVIRKGKLVAAGTPEELQDQSEDLRIKVLGTGFSEQTLMLLRGKPGVHSAEVQSDCLEIALKPNFDTAPLINLLVNAGVQVREVYRDRENLETVILNLMEGQP